MPKNDRSKLRDKTVAKPLPPLAEKDIIRLWGKIQVNSIDECWLWTAKAHFAGGYGALQIAGRPIRATRLVYFLTYGDDPAPLDILHSCDTPGCCNPKHLRKGTDKDNRQDAKSRGRGASGDRNGLRLHPERAARGDQNGSRKHPEKRPKGESHYNAQLTRAMVISMYLAWESDPKLSKTEHARRLGIKRTMFSDIVLGRKWKELFQEWSDRERRAKLLQELV